MKRPKSKERRSASRENSRGDSEERKHSPLPILDDFDDLDEENLRSDQWLKGIKDEIKNQESIAKDELTDLRLGKRVQSAGSNALMNSFMSDDSAKRKRIDE
jgi:hypothetical protein